jgi:hypothetical protein
VVDNRSRQSPILVTGAHRSGTTWVGKMLAIDRHVAYISEPLNVYHRPGVMNVAINHWYTYICPDNESEYLPALQKTLEYRYHTRAELHSLRSAKDILRMGRDWSIFLEGRVFHQRPLLKDPFAVFSAIWFAQRLGCSVVVVVRHPGAFVSSLTRLGWNFDFEDLLAQPLLLRDWLGYYRAEMERLSRSPQDVIVQGCTLWRMIYGSVLLMVQQEPKVRIVRHEDLSIDPILGYRQLYTSLGLEFTQPVEKAIIDSSKEQNPKEQSKHSVHSVRLDSRANLGNWRRRLSDQEIKHVHQITADVADRFYPDESWG